MEKNMILKFPVNAMNDTMDPEGLVPSCLVFGWTPRFSSTESRLRTKQKIMDAMHADRPEMAILTAEIRISAALSSCVIETGDCVRGFCKADKQYVGPYPIIRVDGTQVFIIDNQREVKFNKHQVFPATTYDNFISEKYLVTTLRLSLPNLSSNRSCKSSTVYHKDIPSVLITEVLHHNDPRMRSEQADLARKRKINKNLVRRATWRNVLEEYVPPGSNIIHGSLIIVIKDLETDKPIFKAQFVAHGKRDAEKHKIGYDSTNISLCSVQLLIALAAIMGFDVRIGDII